MHTPQQLLDRLDAIGRSLAATDGALALLGLGSVGLERERLDAYSDLDFFVIVRPALKLRFLETLDWLEAVAPVVYRFRNTADGFKLLFADGIFCEFAVFEPEELTSIPYAPGRIVWKHPEVDGAISLPALKSNPPQDRGREWLLGEALTNLYVGLGRFHRGEKLTAARFIQQYAVDRVLDLAPLVEAPQPAFPDAFTPERRFEQRFPGVAQHLPAFVQGYDRSAESAVAILDFLVAHFEVNPAMVAAIRLLLPAPAPQGPAVK